MDVISRHMPQIKTLKGLEKQVQINILTFQETMLNIGNFLLSRQSGKYHKCTKTVLQRSYFKIKKAKYIIET